MMKKEFNLGWGESVAVRWAFIESLSGAPLMFDMDSLENMGYPAHEGDPDLIKLTKRIIKRNIGRDYAHVLITNGATGGVTLALRTYALLGRKECVTENPPYFRFYPDMIKQAGLQHKHMSAIFRTHRPENPVFLVDSPSNPLGTFSSRVKVGHEKIVWDTVYFNKVYSPGRYPQPDHDVLVGSYSKLLGMNGLRVGWIATNDGLLYESLKRVVSAEYCGISVPSTKIILKTAGRFTDDHWETFENNAASWLNLNRAEWSRLEKFFGDTPTLSVGMFYYAPIDKHCKALLEKSGIIWSHGSQLGATDDFGRFNLGQDLAVIQKAVKTILKNDKR